MSGPPAVPGTVTPPAGSTPSSAGRFTGAFQGTGGDLATWFERLLADLVAGYGRVPVSAFVLIVAALLGAVLVPRLVAGLHWLADLEPLDDRGTAAAARLRAFVPTSFSELLVRTVQVAVAVLAVLALVVVWGYGDVVVDLRRSIATDLQDVIGLSLTMGLIAMAFVGSDLLKRAIERFGQSAQGITQHQQEIALRIGQITLFVTLGAAVLTLWNFNLSGLLVGAGFLGIVVGFAARETLGSLIAGFVLMFSRPFTIGDWVEIDDAEGTVTDITMFNTRLQNVDAETLVIPNDVVSNSTIVNRSRRGRLQIRREVGVDYDTDHDTATEIAADAMKSVDEVSDSPEPEAMPIRFGDSAIVLELRFWIKDPSPQRKWAAVADVFRAVKRAFDDEGIDIPYPQRTISARSSAAGDGDRVVAAELEATTANGVASDGADGEGTTTDGADDGTDVD